MVRLPSACLPGDPKAVRRPLKPGTYNSKGMLGPRPLLRLLIGNYASESRPCLSTPRIPGAFGNVARTLSASA